MGRTRIRFYGFLILVTATFANRTTDLFRASGLIRLSSSLLRSSSITNSSSPNANALKGIQSTIGNLVFIGGATSEHYVALGKSRSGKNILTLDLSKTIFFTNIDLSETTVGSGIYQGYGYDYWSSVSGSPSVNYKFIATRDKVDRALLNIKWQLIPLLSDPVSGEKQPQIQIREELTDSRWIHVLESSISKIPVLEYMSINSKLSKNDLEF